MLCILVRLLITSSTRSSVNEDRLDSLAAIEVSLHNTKLQFKHDMALFMHAHSSNWPPALPDMDFFYVQVERWALACGAVILGWYWCVVLLNELEKNAIKYT